MNVEESVVSEQLKPAVVLTGTAREGRAGPPIGVMDIGESEKAYLCRVALPGLRNNESKFPTYSEFYRHRYILQYVHVQVSFVDSDSEFL